MGPTPTPPPAEPTGGTLDPGRRRLLQALAGRRGAPFATVNDLVTALGGHPNTTRHHLRALVAVGLVEEQHTPPTGGRGRPAARYAVTRAGWDAASPGQRGAAALEYVALAAAFAERLAERGGDPGADGRAIGRAWGATLVAHDAPDASPGADGTSPTDQVLDLLDRLGFSPAVEREGSAAPATGGAGTATGDAGIRDGEGTTTSTVVLLHTCPLLDAARRHPEVVCEVHLGLVAGALEAHDEPSDGVRLEPFGRPGACVLGLPATLVR